MDGLPDGPTEDLTDLLDLEKSGGPGPTSLAPPAVLAFGGSSGAPRRGLWKSYVDACMRSCFRCLLLFKTTTSRQQQKRIASPPRTIPAITPAESADDGRGAGGAEGGAF